MDFVRFHISSTQMLKVVLEIPMDSNWSLVSLIVH